SAMSEKAVFDLYRSLKLWANPICTQCREAARPDLSGPVGIWQVGTAFADDPYRLVFVGKNARGSIRDNVQEELVNSGFIDATGEADKWIREKWAAYWHYTAAVIEQLYGSLQAGWERIAFTNLVKCNNSMDVDTTSTETKSN